MYSYSGTDVASGSRVAGGFLAASAVAALPTILMGPFAVIAFPIGFVIALFHCVGLALPAYLLLRGRIRFRWHVAVATGLVIGALPVTLLGLASGTSGMGELTAVAGAAACGVGGALGFRAVVGDPPPQTVDASIFE
nr:hypothetical protein [Sphingomonas sp.]